MVDGACEVGNQMMHASEFVCFCGSWMLVVLKNPLMDSAEKTAMSDGWITSDGWTMSDEQVEIQEGMTAVYSFYLSRRWRHGWWYRVSCSVSVLGL